MGIEKRKNKFYLITIIILSFILFLCSSFYLIKNAESRLNVSIWDGIIASEFSDGDGTKENPYIIANAQELAFLFNSLNGEDYLNYYNKYYELNANMDLNNYDFSYMNSDNPFKGSINGNGYKIYNFKLSNYYIKDDSKYISLFNNLDNAYISYLNIEDVSILLSDEEKIQDEEENSVEKEQIEDNDNEENINIEEENEEVDIEEESKTFISLLGISANDSSIQNVSFNNISIESSLDEKTILSILFINDNGKNIINNLNIDLKSNIETKQLIYNYKDSKINNIMYTNKDLILLDDESVIEGIYKYTNEDNKIVFEEIGINELLEKINLDNILNWDIEEGRLCVQNIIIEEAIIKSSSDEISDKITNEIIVEKNNNNLNKSNANEISGINGLKSLRSVGNVATFTPHDSEIENNTLYINDLTSDYNYYKSLNYTEVIDGNVLPGSSSTNYYDDQYLIRSEIIYDGTDINDNSLVGRVSPSENVNKYIYYKYYPLERDSNGNLLVDGNGYNYIKIELIDNPFSTRPTDKGFNGWGTLESDIVIEYDKDSYTRYAIVPINNTNSISVTFNAVWTDANVQVGNNTRLNSLDNAGMKAATKVITVNQTSMEDYNCNPYFNQNIKTIPTNYSGRVARNSTINAGVYYTTNNNANISTNTTLYYASSNTTCNASGGGSGTKYCYYYTPTSIASGTAYNTNNTYNIIYSYNNNYRYTTNVNNYISYNTCQREVVNQVQKTVSLLDENDISVGYYYYVGNNYNASSGLYYDSTGKNCKYSANSCSSGAYKLIQYNDSLTNSDGSSISIINTNSNGDVIDYNNYYYLVTRDMNILIINSSNVNLTNYVSTKPYTLTGSNGNSIANDYVTVGNSNITINADMVIENINIYGYGGSTVSETATSTGSIGANFHNLKIGRNVRYVSNNGTVSDINKVFNGVYGINDNYTGTASSPQRFKIIVESGTYNYLLSGSADGVGSTRSNYYINAKFIYGSDYDRVLNDNSKLKVYFNALSTIKDNFVSSQANKNLPSSYIDVKSGRYGKNSSNGYSTSNTQGIYVGGRTTTHYANALRVLRLEGGDINIINGGPCVEEGLTSNSVAIYMSGGTVRQIYGGAGTTTTYGNRIVSITGGTVSYSVFGGSNAYDSGSEGLLTGSTLVYIGGDATIGSDDILNANTKLFNVGSGNVFGAGNGADGGTSAGIVNNSHVIINGGTIKNSVYAGGNHGSVGTRTSTGSTTAVIDIFDGQINNSVFGAGESVGGGYNITQSDPDKHLTSDYYTGYNVVRTVYTTTTSTTVREDTGAITSGPTTTNQTTNGYVPAGAYMPDGSINNNRLVCTTSVAGSTEEAPTTETTTNRTSSGNFWNRVYYTTTNVVTTTTTTCYYATNIASSGSLYNTNTNTNYYIINNNEFVQVTPQYEVSSEVSNTYNHSVLINLDGGIVTNSIYGGSNSAGTLYGNVNINLLSGTSGGAYGGGKGVTNNNEAVKVMGNTTVTSNTTDDTSLNVTNVYGGSALGSVNQYGATNVTINGGTITNVYGGGEGDSNTNPNTYGNIKVEVQSGDITNVYGGNNLSGIPSGNVEVYLNGGTTANAFGGGSSSSVTTSNIYLQDDAVVGNIFGGSNLTGNVTTSNVYLEGGTSNYVYGSNNVGGSTTTSNIIASRGSIISIYGGGKEAQTTTTNVTINGTTVTNVFGGGEEASVLDSTNISLISGEIDNVYGGSNISGNVPITNIEATGGKVDYIYGGGKLASTQTSNVLIDGVEVENVFGGGESANVDNTNVKILSGRIPSVYGGSNTSGDVLKSNVVVVNGTISDLYGGNNQGGEVEDSNLTISDGIITSVYGGGNATGGNITNVNLAGGTVTNVYGGSNTTGDISSSNINSSEIAIDLDYMSESTNTEVDEIVYNTMSEITLDVTNNTNNTLNNWSCELTFSPDTILNIDESNYNITVVNNKAIITPSNGNSELTSLGAYETKTIQFSVLSTANNSSFKIKSKDITSYDRNQNDLTVSNIYGGNNQGGTTVNTNINLKYGEYDSIYGGGNFAVSENTSVDVTNINVSDIYGGGNQANVTGNTTLKVNDSDVTNNIYGGGNAADVLGNSDTIVSGDVNVGRNIFAGGNSGAIGSSTINNSTSKLVITGANVGGNVYGGCNTSVVYGRTLVNIGYNEDNDPDLKKGNINVTGTVFGGGEANAEGSEIFDYSFISVTRAISINIDGLDYLTDGYDFYLNGSIFGSGNASQSSGTSDIYIAHLGSLDNPSKNISIQRTDKVIIDNSVIELSGTTDRTNEYSNRKYALNRIDLLVLKNSSAILLRENANLLKSFKSAVDIGGEEVLASVTIDDDTQTVTKNVDNRVYLEAGKILNVTTNENADAYGEVKGMSFLGMYNKYDDGSVSYGMYDTDFTYGSSADASDMITGGSYVIGLHANNHDITKDGFYTNYINDEYTELTTAYINPTPEDATYYMWTIGVAAINYTIELTASKYSSLGTGSLSLIDFASGDTEFDVVGFSVDRLANGISLVDSNNVPRFASDVVDANSIFGVSMKTETTEWTNSGTTKLLSSNNGSAIGTKVYKTDSIPGSPTLNFYMYHAKNINQNQDLGTVLLTLQAKVPKNEIEYDVKLVTITIVLSARMYDDDTAYDASITYGTKYDIPAATDVKITNKSQFTAYYSLYEFLNSDDRNFYGANNDYHRSLISSFALPVGTTITMIDLASDDNNPNYYYYIVNSTDYANSLLELDTYNEVSYDLSKFIKMDSTSSNNTYNDLIENNNYLRDSGSAVFEEFIFIFDFKDTTFTGEYLDNSILLELRNNESRSVVSVLGIRQNLMQYSLYDQTNAVLEQVTTTENQYLYYNQDKEISMTTNVLYDETANRVKIIDTNYESNSMGINVKLKDSAGNQVSSQLLMGTYISIDGVRYHTDNNGIFRIKLADKVSNLSKRIILNSSDTLPAGNYTMNISLFSSNDGLHSSGSLSDSSYDMPLIVVNNNNVIKVELQDYMKLIDGETALNELGTNIETFNVKYNSSFDNPNIRVVLYKRNVDSANDITYQEVNIRDYFSDTISFPTIFGYTSRSIYEYMVFNNPSTLNTVSYTLKDSLTSGTYKMVFKLYDGNNYIDEDYENIIIQK